MRSTTYPRRNNIIFIDTIKLNNKENNNDKNMKNGFGDIIIEICPKYWRNYRFMANIWNLNPNWYLSILNDVSCNVKFECIRIEEIKKKD